MRYGLIILILICAFDLLFTTIGIINGKITEKSPILSWYYLKWGIYGLIGAKVFFNTSSTFILEALARKKLISDNNVKFYYSLIIILYLFGLIGGSIYTTFTD